MNLPYVSKLLERVVAEQILSHLNQHFILNNIHSAYRQEHCCETAKLRVFNDVLCSADGGQMVLLVILDLGAAFDTTDNEILLTRLYDEVGTSSTASVILFLTD